MLPPAGHLNRTSAIATDRDAIGAEADVAITKTGPASIVAGNPLVYTITVTNTGPSDAAGVVVSDATPTGLVFVSTTGDCTTAFPCTLGVLPASATRTITATFTVPPDYSGPSPIENVTNASSTTFDTNTANNTATALTTLNRDADVEVTKTVPSSGVLVGDEIAVTITALNLGPNPATGIEITESLPAGFDFVSASASQGAYDPATGAWSVGSLAVSETAQLVLTATVTAPGVITNLAVKTGQNEPDPIVGNDSAAARTTATPAADLEVDKEVDRHDALVGETLTFTVRATNRGPSPATGITIADALPIGLSFVSAAASQGSYDTATGIWTVGALDSPAQATLTLVARVDQPGALTNNAAMASQDQIDPNPLNNSDAESVNAAPAADLRVAKAVSDAAPGVGALVTYTIAVTNLGPNDATSAEVSDALPAGVAFVSARASQGSYDEGTGIWTLGAVPVSGTEILRLTGRVTELGTLVNTATRQSSTPVDPNAANDTGTATLTSSVVADLSLTKTPSVPVAAAGTAFTWTVAVVNNGPSNAVGASVTDSFPAPFTGVTWTCTASSGSSCTSPAGTGTIATTVDLLAGGTATFVATGLSAPGGSSLLVNVATVAVAAGTTDPDLSNNTDTSAVGLASLADAQVTQAGPSSLAPGTSGGLPHHDRQCRTVADPEHDPDGADSARLRAGGCSWCMREPSLHGWSACAWRIARSHCDALPARRICGSSDGGRASACRERSLRSTSREQCRQRGDDRHAARRPVDHQDRADNCRSWSASDLCGHGRQCRTFCRDRGQRGRSDAGRIDVGVNERRLHDRLPLRSGDDAAWYHANHRRNLHRGGGNCGSSGNHQRGDRPQWSQ